MAERSQDWLRQAESDLCHARKASEVGDFRWAVWAAHQAAEEAVNALYRERHLGTPELLSLLMLRPEKSPLDLAEPLDKNYTRKDADEAIAGAEAIVEFLSQ